MDHVELKEVVLPIGTPLLMANQTFPWNGDGYLAGEVLRLRDEHGLTCALETGTCLGVTTSWLMDHFGFVATCEACEPFYARAYDILRRKSDSVIVRLVNSVEFLSSTISANADAVFFIFLDAHGISGTGKEHCPLLEELDTIAHYCGIGAAKPCILIHDFQVPGTDFGFDKMPDGRPFNLELVKPYLERIYGEGKYRTNYPTVVEGAKRGWISVEPC